jgi:hypothetical protein
MTTLRTAIEELLIAVDMTNASLAVRRKADRLREALGTEPDSDGMATEQDGFRVEAAGQFGFQNFNDDCTEHRCTTAQLVAFAKACERAGMFQAHGMGSRDLVAKRMAEIDAELKPILEAETARSMTAAGYVRAPENHPSGLLWIKPESHEIAARQAGWALTDSGVFERSASDEPERVHLLGDWKELCEFAAIDVPESR